MKIEELYMLRLCKPEEAETDAPILATLIQAMATDLGEYPEKEPLTDLLYSLLTTGFSEFIIAEVNEEPVGCIQMNYRLSTLQTAPYAHLSDFYIQPEVRQLGIGKSMLDYACQRIEARGCKYVEMDVPPEDTKAVKLYQSMGFRSYSTLKIHTDLPRHGTCKGHAHDNMEETPA
jgi:ribosomal protein S18 acetylase RimI-like enzyme